MSPDHRSSPVSDHGDCKHETRRNLWALDSCPRRSLRRPAGLRSTNMERRRQRRCLGGKANWEMNDGSPIPPEMPVDDFRVFIFNVGTLNTDQIINLNASRTVDQLVFRSPGRTTINEGNGGRLMMSEGPENTDLIIRNGTGRVTLASDVRVTRQNDWTHRGAEEFNIDGVLDLSSQNQNGRFLRSTLLSHPVVAASFRGGIAGPATSTIVKDGPGRLTISGDNSDTFSGQFIVNEGELRITSV